MSQTIAIAGRSDVGQLRRRNEDYYAVLPHRGVAVVADGMGGHPGGDVASRIAAETAADNVADAVGRGEGDEDFVQRFREVMDAAVVAAHDAVREEGRVQPDLSGMGTTLTAMIVDPGSGAWVVGHVGDSRAYRLRNGTLEQLTRDDTWVQDQIDRGDMGPESARLSPYAHLLTQCVGLEDEPTVHLFDGKAEEGDVFLLCTDGLVGMLEDHEVAEILRERFAHSHDPAEPLEALVAAANEAGGHDNITAVLVRYG